MAKRQAPSPGPPSPRATRLSLHPPVPCPSRLFLPPLALALCRRLRAHSTAGESCRIAQPASPPKAVPPADFRKVRGCSANRPAPALLPPPQPGSALPPARQPCLPLQHHHHSLANGHLPSNTLQGTGALLLRPCNGSKGKAPEEGQLETSRARAAPRAEGCARLPVPSPPACAHLAPGAALGSCRGAARSSGSPRAARAARPR